MALINCSECGVKISDKADYCPKCGNPGKGVKNFQQIESKEGCFLQSLNAGCMVILVIIVIVLIVLLLLNILFNEKSFNP